MHRIAANAEFLKCHNFNYYQKKLPMAFFSSKNFHCLWNDVNFVIFPVLDSFGFSFENSLWQETNTLLTVISQVMLNCEFRRFRSSSLFKSWCFVYKTLEGKCLFYKFHLLLNKEGWDVLKLQENENRGMKDGEHAVQKSLLFTCLILT